MITITRISDDLPNLTEACSAAERMLAVQVVKDTRPYVPALTQSLNQRTRIYGNRIVYPGPYARYLYEGKVMVDSVTGKGPAKIPEVGYRFRKGATLVPTSRNLTYTKSVHPLAQDHWMDASKRKNNNRWKAIIARAIQNGLK